MEGRKGWKVERNKPRCMKAGEKEGRREGGREGRTSCIFA
jgi:hypothetical protein